MEKIELQEGQKPVQGVPSGFGRGTTIYTTDNSGRITQAITSGAPLDTSNVVPVSIYENPARVGDYYYDTTGRLQVWKNSPTDFIQRYKIAIGGTAAPANTVSLANEGVGAVSGASIGSLVGLIGGPIGAGIGAAIGALAGGLTAHNEAASQALKAWQNEDIKYDSAVEFYKDENGDIKYKLDYSKMGVGGVRSGEGIKEAQNVKTTVTLGDDGRLKVTTNPIFATTSRYQELIDWISENYAGLNKDTENLDEVLTEIQNGIDGEAQDFITNTRLYADYANRFSADPNIITASYMTEIAGYVDPKNMKDYDVAIIGDNGNIETKSSQELFDSVYNMSADDKNRLLEKLNNIVYSTDGTYSENEKAIAFGELRALYAVSENTEKYEDDKYQGMLNADPLINFLTHFSPLGLNAADVINFVSGGNAIQTKQEYLNQNDLAVFMGAVGGTLAGLGVFKAGTALIEKGMKLLPGTKQLFQASLEGQSGGALAAINQLRGNSGALLKASAASAAFKILKVGTFDAALSGTKSLTSKTDFWTELGQDFARDATLEMVFSYLDMVKFQSAVTDNMVQAVVNPKTGNIEVLPTTEKVYTDDGIEMPQVATGGMVTTPAGERIGYADVNGTKVFYRNGQIMTVSPTGDVVNDAPINGVPALKNGVNVQSDPNVDIATALTKAGYSAGTNVLELSSKSLDSAVAAGKFAKWDTSKVGLAINKALFNKNAALDAVNNMALAKTGDRNAWQNAQEYFVSVWDNAEREITNISNGTYYPEAVKAFDDYTFQFGQLNLAQKYTKKDANYLKALIQIERAQYLNDTRIPGDERDYVAEAMEKYSGALAIPEDRAQALQQFSEIRKARHDATKEAALRSGWVDAKRLTKVMESDMQKEIGWVPVWGKKQTYNGLLNTFYGITPERNPQKRWLNKGEWVDLDVLEDPLTADERFLSFVGTNMGINAMKDITVDILGKAGLLLDETPVQEHSNLLSSVKNVDKLEKGFNDLVAKRRKEIEKKVPSEKQYADMMGKLVEDSGVIEALDDAITSLEPIPAPTGVHSGSGKISLLAKNVEKFGSFMGWLRDGEFDPNNLSKDVDKVVRRKFESLPTEIKAVIENEKNYQYLKNSGRYGDKAVFDHLAIDFPLSARFIEERVQEIMNNPRTSENPISNLTDTVRNLLNKAAEYNNQFGYEFDVESYMNTSAIPNLTEAVNKRDKNLGAAIINQAILDVAPYQSREALLHSQQEDVAREWREWAEKNVKTDGDKKQAVDLVAAKINGETTDAYEMGAATTASGMGGRYPITWFKNGKPYTRFIKYDTPEQQRLAEEITHLFEDKQLIKNPGIIDRAARTFANNFRLLTTALDVTRAPLNFVRDTVRGEQTSGGESFINPGELFKSVLELGDYTPEQKQKLSEALDDVARKVAGETYNKAYGNKRKAQVAITKEYLSKSGANPLKRFIYNAKHDKMSLLEKPADFFEGLTRRRLAKSAATVALRKTQMEGKSFDEQIKILYSSATFAGREYTANFARKGTLIGATSRYVAYQSSAYAGLDGLKRAFINNPQGVARNFATFLVCYVILLADTLGDEESRKNYYRLSDYDRGNSLVISLGDNTVLTIPLDQEIASLLFPYRRFIETLNGVDPVSFFELMWGTFTEPMPFDLSGFTEGEGFNLSRGLEKLTAQNMPTGLTPIQEAATGYDLYYGSDLEVTDETLRDYGIYDPQAGDYTTAGNNSQLLRNIANATGIPQWQLQVMVSGYGGNVGQYVLNIIDKLSGASEDAQGGKDFANAIFKSFVATDQDNANSVFYDGIQKLKQEKNKVIQTIANYNDQLATATGETKVEIQNRIQKAKNDYATKVGDFVDQYISAYEITGGLPKSQAMQVYYLFRFDDDDTVYQAGSVEEYYNNQAIQQFKNEATRLSAPILDRYYNNRIGNIYQDSDGTWRHYLSSGAQAMKNTVYGAAEQQKVDLLNILEGQDSLKSLRNQIKNARSQAFDAKNYDIADKLGYELDRRVIARIKPYIDQYGAENVLGNTEVLDYLSDWFIVPDEFIRTKKGKYVSLAHNASSQEAFVRPFIKYIFGLPTNYYSYSDTNLTGPSL